MTKRSELIDVTLLLRGETEKAIQVTEGLMKDGEEIKVWLPRSQIEIEYPESSDTIVVTMPRWLFEEKGFTGD